MNGSAALLAALIVLALVWAYSRHAFDAWLGLATPHGVTPGGPDLPIVHTGHGYGELYRAATVAETGPATGPTGVTATMRVVRPATVDDLTLDYAG